MPQRLVDWVSSTLRPHWVEDARSGRQASTFAARARTISALVAKAYLCTSYEPHGIVSGDAVTQLRAKSEQTAQK